MLISASAALWDALSAILPDNLQHSESIILSATLSEVVLNDRMLYLTLSTLLDALEQWFSNLSYKNPCPAHFVCLPCQTHPIRVLQSLLTSWWVESGVSDKGDIQNVRGRDACRTGLKTTALEYLMFNLLYWIFSFHRLHWTLYLLVYQVLYQMFLLIYLMFNKMLNTRYQIFYLTNLVTYRLL